MSECVRGRVDDGNADDDLDDFETMKLLVDRTSFYWLFLDSFRTPIGAGVDSDDSEEKQTDRWNEILLLAEQIEQERTFGNSDSGITSSVKW